MKPFFLIPGIKVPSRKEGVGAVCAQFHGSPQYPVLEKTPGVEKNKGFTLVEVVVVVVVFGMLMTMVMQSYWGLVQAYQKAEVMRQLQRESNFALTRIADKMRYHSLNYAEQISGECAGAAEKLCIGDYVFTYDDGEGTLTMADQPLFSAGSVEVVDFRFSYTPDADPFASFANRQLHPKLTVFLSVASRKEPGLKMDLQTTISSRKYNAQ